MSHSMVSHESSSLTGTVTSVLKSFFGGPQRRHEASYTLSEVSLHCHCNDCWIVVRDHVYDVTSFLDKHPGGIDVMMEHAGRDATVAFYTSGHHPSTIQLLEPFCIGTLAQHERVNLIGSLGSTDNREAMWSSERVNLTVAE